MVQSVRPLLLSFGYFEETVDKWGAGAMDEIENMKNKYYVRVSPVSTQRRSACEKVVDLSVPVFFKPASGCLHGLSSQENRRSCVHPSLEELPIPLSLLLHPATMYQQGIHTHWTICVLLPYFSLPGKRCSISPSVFFRTSSPHLDINGKDLFSSLPLGKNTVS